MLNILQYLHRDMQRKHSTWNPPPSHAERAYPQNCMVEQAKNQVSDMHFDKFPNPSTFQFWKTSLKTEFSYGSFVEDQRKGYGRCGGRSEDVAVDWRT